jgi:hypothetical protein
MSLEKISKYREETLWWEADEVEMFRDEVERGAYPSKCLKCYQLGLRNCRYWADELAYGCEEVEEGEIVDLAMKFVKRERVKL